MTGMLNTGSSRLNVSLCWERIGDDWSITLSGGERPHIGAAAAAWWQGERVEWSVVTVPGHRETELAFSCAVRCCAVLQKTVLVSCGIHIDAAEKAEVEQLVEMAAGLTERFLEKIREI